MSAPESLPDQVSPTTPLDDQSTKTSSSPAITVHHLNNSRSQRILWLLEELEIPYEIKKYKRNDQNLAPKELQDIMPLGKAPFITDGDIKLAESGAIVEYIISKYGQAKAKVPESGWIDNLYFTHYAEGSLQPVLVRKYMFAQIPKNSPVFVRPVVNMVFTQLEKKLVQPELQKHGQFIEAHLAKTGDWFAGGDHPTSADFMMSFCLETFVSRAPDSLGPKTKEYVKKVQQRPAYKRAIDKGGEYAYIMT